MVLYNIHAFFLTRNVLFIAADKNGINTTLSNFKRLCDKKSIIQECINLFLKLFSFNNF